MGNLSDGQIYELVAPVGGWNTRDPLPIMDEIKAIKLINMIAGPGSVRKRKGYEAHSDIEVEEPVESLLSYNAPSGSQVLIAAINNTFYDVTTDEPTEILQQGELEEPPPFVPTDNKWRSVHFMGKLIFTNDTGEIAYYPNSFDEVAEATWSSPPNCVNVGVYNERLYFIEKDSTSFFYGGTQVTGTGGTPTLTEYDAGSLLVRGGYLIACGNSTNNIGLVESDVFVIVSSEGEVLTFQGSSPDSETWRLLGRFFLPRPLGYKCVFNRGADLHIITEGGVFSLSMLLASGGEVDRFNALTDEIGPSFLLEAKRYGSTYGWEGLYYSKDSLVVINIPDPVGARQFVVNVGSPMLGWSQFQDIPAISLVISGGDLYFGDSLGKVWKYGETENDNGEAISIYGQTAFTDCGMPNFNKLVTMIMPIVKKDPAFILSLGLNIDFAETGTVNEITSDSSAITAWDTVAWDDAEWSGEPIILPTWYSCEGLGLRVSVIFEAEVLNTSLEIFEFYLLYKRGGIL